MYTKDRKQNHTALISTEMSCIVVKAGTSFPCGGQIRLNLVK